MSPASVVLCALAASLCLLDSGATAAPAAPQKRLQMRKLPPTKPGPPPCAQTYNSVYPYTTQGTSSIQATHYRWVSPLEVEQVVRPDLIATSKAAMEISMNYIGGGNGVSGLAQAPLHLPDGATIRELHVSAYENDGRGVFTLELASIDHQSHNRRTIASVNSGCLNGWGDLTLGKLSVNNPDPARFEHVVEVSWHTSKVKEVKLRSIRVGYTLP
ncbi:MAG: hypothetical protein JW940_07845 [Polyangiaceae bacterium]|nr:hypothetical protein [Polyangiaceae bacterium]